jgi:hypothetical protein
VALEAAAINSLKQPPSDQVEVKSEQLTLLSVHPIAERRGMPGGRAAQEAVECGPVTVEEPATVVEVLDLVGLEAEQPSSLADLEHPVTAYLQ